ncbi:MAG: flavodoxin [Clostridia bacterium]|nr:flavodoxin [Clostridia bacterium]
MKKIITLLLMVCMCISMAACGNQQEADNTASASDNTANEENQSETTEPEVTEAPESSTEQAEVQEPSAEAETADTTEGGSSTLVVYFSNTGNTRAIAESISNGLGADVYEIIAQEPYTEADLDYGDNNSRSTVEMNDPSARPAISGSIENMDQYDTVYIGYPIWWGEAPRILDTFVESYDFTDKTVVPFCTSASSGMGSSASTLEELAGSGNWLDGQRFSGSESAESVMEWVNGL